MPAYSARLLQEANPLLFDGVTTGVVFNEGLIDFVCERIEAMTDDAIGAVLERR